GPLAPASALCERPTAPDPAGLVDRARPLGARLRHRARPAIAGAARRRARDRHRAVLRPGHMGDGRLPRPLPALRCAGGLGDGRRHAVTRVRDTALAGLGLAIARPALAVAAVATKLDDGGPVFYRQRRVGLHGVEFDLVKLRTMSVGAEQLGAGYAVNEGDPRITRVGRALRRLSIDEIPQLWNVVRGDMSLIGPRPTLAY